MHENMEELTGREERAPMPPVFGGAVFALLSLALLSVHVLYFAPNRARIERPQPFTGDRSALSEAMAPDSVAATFRAISDLGSRAPGQPGLEATALYIEDDFAKLGFEIYRQDVDIPYPLLREDSGWMSNETFRLDVLPFRPNFVQPVTTGAQGIDGELFLATDEAIRNGIDFTGKIAVIDTGGSIFKDFGLDPVRYADIGFAAVIITHAGGIEKMPWEGRATGETSLPTVPVNIVRVACGPEVLAHIGETVHLDVRSVWGERRTRNIVGVLRNSVQTNTAALIVPVEYDAFSILPDCANSSLQALQSAVLMQLAKGLAPYRDTLRRDIVFVAATGSGHAQSGLSRLISTIGEYGRRDFAPEYISGKIAEHERTLATINALLKLFDNGDFAVAGRADRTRALIEGLSPESRHYLGERYAALARKAVFLEEERLLQAKIAYERNPSDLASPAFAAYCTARKRHDEVNNLSGLPLTQLLRRNAAATLRLPLPDSGDASVRDALRATLVKFAAFHADRLRSCECDLRLQRMLAQYKDFFVLGTRCAPCPEAGAAEKIGVAGGRGVSTGDALEQFHTIADESAHALGLDGKVSIEKGDSSSFSGIFTESMDFNTLPFAVVSYPACTIASIGQRVRNPFFPFRQPEMEDLSSASGMLAVLGETARSLALGRGQFDRLPKWGSVAVRGAVLAEGVGSSAVPNFAVEGALVCSLDGKPCMMTDPYGRYENAFQILPALAGQRNRPYNVFLFDENGAITHVKDFGSAAQNIFASKTMRFNNAPVNHILFRASPVALLNRVNPQTLKAFAGFDPVRRRGLAAFPSTCRFMSDKVLMEFLPPDARFHLLLKDGAFDNEYVSVTRAFCLGTRHSDDPSWQPSGNEIDGPGYLAADTAFFRDLPEEAYASMSWLAGKRLALQSAYQMADALTLAFDSKSAAIATNAAEHTAEKPCLDRRQEYGAALSYQILNHPVIRGTVSEAVSGILWYLGLLVPFAFFFEKLVFGFADIRRRLLVQGAVFLVTFGLLRLLHPAFHMIRSSSMILLGFVIMLAVGAVTLLLSGKFKECVDALRGGSAKGVSGNSLGIALTAFLLGLNNMHRRRLRTGLTCATLALMTFATICFLTVNSDVVDSERAVGSAGYQGLVFRKKQFRPISGAETDAFRLAFPKHRVSRRQIFAAFYNGSRGVPDAPSFTLTFGEGDRSRTRTVRAALGFDATEPLAGQMPLLSTNGWFTVAQQEDDGEPRPVIMPDVLAAQLGITPEMVDAGAVPVVINGKRFSVHNVFDSTRFHEIVDPDGANLLPYDGLSMNTMKFGGWGVILAEETDPRVAPADLILVLTDDLEMDRRGIRTASIAVDMGDVPYATAQSEIVRYKEQSGSECFYALAGTAFRGSRARTRSLAGFADLIVPLLIAAITVLNTMKGSVYERQGEIGIYNAIGIAPRHIFFMFVAEALVYSVVGTVLGCLLAQGAGRILASMGVTAGLDMNFASLSSVYASLAIAAATLLSTWYPARTAMEIAKPADNAGWSLPAPDADGRLSTLLPFTFTHHDRIAVLAFLHDYFDSLGEGSSGIFFSGRPELRVSDRLDDLADGAYIPELKVRVWLKPFDLGVSQDVEIELGTDPETREYIAKMTITRITGTLESWHRLNKPFVTAVRHQFLHWRAVGDTQKSILFAKARALFALLIQYKYESKDDNLPGRAKSSGVGRR